MTQRRRRRRPVSEAATTRSPRQSLAEAQVYRHEQLNERLLRRRNDDFALLLTQLGSPTIQQKQALFEPTDDVAVLSQLKALAPSAAAGYRAEMDRVTEALKKMFRRADPLEVLGIASVVTTLHVRGTFYEPTSGPGDTRVEFIAGLLASVKCGDPQRLMLSEITLALSLVESLYDLVFLKSQADDLATPPDRPEEDLGVMSRAYFTEVRGTTYKHHGEELARRLFQPHAESMHHNLGFSLDDVLELENRVLDRMTRSVNDLAADAEGSAARSNAARPSTASSGSRDDDEYRRLLGLKILRGARDTLAFRIDDVADATLGADRIAAILERLSLPLGEGHLDRHSPLSRSPLLETPFVRWKDEFALPLAGALGRESYQVLQPIMFEVVPRWERKRAKVLDELGVEHVIARLPDARVAFNAYYEATPGEPASLTEVDAIIVWDRFVIVVEGKAGTLSDVARRGNPDAIRDSLKRTIISGGRQSNRLRNLLSSNSETAFHDGEGREVLRLSNSDFDDIFMIIPTLQHFSGLELQLQRIAEIAQWNHDDVPFIVFVNQLRVISELTSNPAEFLHYLRWRRRLPLGDIVFAVDEVDLFSAYLHRVQVLRSVHNTTPPFRFMLVGTSTPIDDYFYYEAGIGNRFKKPEMKHSSLTRRFVRRMSNERPPGWLDAAGTCLDLSRLELRALEGQATILAKRITDAEALVLRIELEPESSARPDELPSMAIVGIGRKTPTATAWSGVQTSLDDVERIIFLSLNAKRQPIVRWALTNPDRSGSVSRRPESNPES